MGKSAKSEMNLTDMMSNGESLRANVIQEHKLEILKTKMNLEEAYNEKQE